MKLVSNLVQLSPLILLPKAGSVYQKPNRISVFTINRNRTEIHFRKPTNSVYILREFLGIFIPHITVMNENVLGTGNKIQ